MELLNPSCLCDIIPKNIDAGFYDAELTELYTKAEIDELNEYIKHERDEVLIMRPPVEQFLKIFQ